MPVREAGRICPGSGNGSFSGQYMMHGTIGSRETFCTRPPAANARPEGVRSGYIAPGAFRRSLYVMGDDGSDEEEVEEVDAHVACLGAPAALYDDGSDDVLPVLLLWLLLLLPWRLAKRGEGWAGSIDAR